jgi:phospholipid/cholesterol/gamma-HCH transport system substrate-binding protein
MPRMEREANYTAVGAFVLLVTVMVGLFVYWYSEGRDRRSYVPYEIYFQGSVTGLSEGGSVRYLGVEVGKVQRIRLDPRSADRVQVVTQIDQAAPISDQTTAELSLLGITGLLYIDLRQNVAGREMMASVPSERYPVIRSVRSNFDTFLASLPEIAGSAAELLQRAQQIFSPENSAALADMVKNLHAASSGLPATMRRVDVLVTELQHTSSEVRSLARNLDHSTQNISPHIEQLAQRLNGTADNLEQASRGISQFVADNQASVAGFAQDGLPQLQRTLAEARAAAEAFEELSRSLKDNPSQLIYKPAPRGVEVPR